MHQPFQDHHRLCLFTAPCPTLVSTPWTFPASSRSTSFLEGCLFSVQPTHPLVLEASPSGHTASCSLDLTASGASVQPGPRFGKDASAALPGRMMGNACRKDLVWPQRDFACVPMSRVDTFYRTGHWPWSAVLAGPLTAHPGDCMHICVSRVIIGHNVTGGPSPGACSKVP